MDRRARTARPRVLRAPDTAAAPVPVPAHHRRCSTRARPPAFLASPFFFSAVTHPVSREDCMMDRNNEPLAEDFMTTVRGMVAAALVVSALSCAGAWAQAYPNKPIRLIAPSSTGSGVD